MRAYFADRAPCVLGRLQKSRVLLILGVFAALGCLLTLSFISLRTPPSPSPLSPSSPPSSPPPPLPPYPSLIPPADDNKQPFPLSWVEQPCRDFSEYGPEETHAIPNIVHYVWMVKDRSEFRLDFRIFLTVYSAYLFLRPDAIYLHTDADPVVFEAARKPGSGHDDVWTARVLAIPGVQPKYVVPPKQSAYGISITELAHASDFIRIDAMREIGGVYLDTDAIPLRDMAALRRTGFANVLGYQAGLQMAGQFYVNNGAMLSRPGSLLMDVWRNAAHRFFDGRWDTASVLLLTDMSQRLSVVPGEVLILPHKALSPVSFEDEDQEALFLPILDRMPVAEPRAEVDTSCQSAMAWATERESRKTFPLPSAEMDFSTTYVLHAFDGHINNMEGWDGKIDLEYIMERRSNYARVVYPAVWHAIQAGVIPEGKKYIPAS